MVRELNMDTQRQNFWKESIQKEATVRLMWHTRYSKEFSRSTFAPKKRQEGLVIKPLSNLKVADTKKNATDQKSLQASSKEKFEAAAKTNLDDLLVEMRPVSTDTKGLLYKGFSALGEGRYQYLQQRKLKKPEDKYEFPITSAWEVGWKINEYVPAVRGDQFGRTKVIKDSFYRPNGIFYH